MPSLPNRGGLLAALMERVRVAKRHTRPLRAAVVQPSSLSLKPVVQRASNLDTGPKRLNAGEQWAKLSGVLERAVCAAASAETLQASATQQLDLAQYGLTTLVDELSAVMTLPGRRSRSATLHTLGGLGDPLTKSGKAATKGRALAA